MIITLPDPKTTHTAWIPAPWWGMASNHWMVIIVAGLILIALAVAIREFSQKSMIAALFLVVGLAPTIIGTVSGLTVWYFHSNPPKPTSQGQQWSHTENSTDDMQLPQSKVIAAGYVSPQRDSYKDAVYLNSQLTKAFNVQPVAQGQIPGIYSHVDTEAIQNNPSNYTFNNTPYYCVIISPAKASDKQGNLTYLKVDHLLCVNKSTSVTLDPH